MEESILEVAKALHTLAIAIGAVGVGIIIAIVLSG